jgi:hypothetical protein
MIIPSQLKANDWIEYIGVNDNCFTNKIKYQVRKTEDGTKIISTDRGQIKLVDELPLEKFDLVERAVRKNIWGEERQVEQMKPNYYSITVKGVSFDVIDIAQALSLPFEVANALKYQVRAGKKSNESELKDLRKAVENLNRRIQFLEKEGDK